MKKTLRSKLALSRLRYRLKHDRGAVLVEAAICIPLLLVVIFGAAEAGLAWEAKSATVSGVRTGVLRASTEGDRAAVDMRILQSIIGEVGGNNADRVNHVVIFDIPVGGDPAAAYTSCATGGGAGCVFYDQSVITQITGLDSVAAQAFAASNFDDGNGGVEDANGDLISYSCDAGLDQQWCSGSRVVGGDTQLGVGISYTHDWVTGILPFAAPTFEEFVVSSTFTDGGAEIDPSSPVAAAFSTLIYDNFGFNSDISDYPGVVVSGLDRNNGDFGGIVRNGANADIALSGLTPGSTVCVTFDLYVLGDVEDHQDSFTVGINGSQSSPVIFEGTGSYHAAAGANAHVTTIRQCGTVDASGNTAIVFDGNYSTNSEGFGIDNLTIEKR